MIRNLPLLPYDWEWTKIDDITISVRDGTHAPPPRVIEGVPLLSARNIKDGFIDWKDKREKLMNMMSDLSSWFKECGFQKKRNTRR